MRYCKYGFYCLIFLLSCTRDYNDLNRWRGGYYDPGRDDRRFYGRDGRYGEIERLRVPNHFIRSELENRYRGGVDFEIYDGELCEENDFCKDTCDTILHRTYKTKCYKSPRAVVERLEESMFILLDISRVDYVEISPGMIAGMLDIGLDFVMDLVENRMSEGDLKSFLAWVAINRSIAEIFLAKDRRSRVIDRAFRALGRMQQVGVTNEVVTGLNVGLIRDDDSFLYLSASEYNRAAFKIGYQILRSDDTRDYKLKQLCAREAEFRNRRSRIGGASLYPIQCRTAFQQTRRTSRSTVCYIHGTTVWSYLDELIDEGEIRDSDFELDGQEVTVEVCNRYCGGENSRRCPRIL